MTIRLNRTVAVFATLVFASLAIAEDETLPVAPEAFIYCTVCHGVQLGGNETLKAPRLSDLSPWFVARQLEAFQKGWRGTHPEDYVGMEMRPMAEALTESQVIEAAEFAARSESPLPEFVIEGDVAAGEKLYESCAACHGADGKGIESLGGSTLVGQNDWYLVHQLENYISGKRGFHPDDIYGQRMRAAVHLLIDEQAVLDVVAYINSLSTH